MGRRAEDRRGEGHGFVIWGGAMVEHVHEWRIADSYKGVFQMARCAYPDCILRLGQDEIERRLNFYGALKDWQDEAVTWIRHLEDEGDHTHDGLEDFIAAALDDKDD
jgi:hypothetical protein